MAQEVLLALAAVLILGMAAQALAWRLRVPSILALLVVGTIAGPVTGLLDPDALLGDLLRPLVALGVAVLLFEGGLSLDVRQLRAHGTVVLRLVTVGLVVTGIIGALAAVWILGMEPGAAAVLGAVLVVIGPTVVGPLLRQVRPGKDTETILRWEGIVNDPIGALLAVIVFEAVLRGMGTVSFLDAGLSLLVTILAGSAIGAAIALLLVAAERRYMVPDFLAAGVALAGVVGAFTAAELVAPESGLFAATVMGMTLANQRRISVRHIVDFKEDLSQILIGSLFILLAARIKPEELALIDWRVGLFVLVLILIARPLAVLASTVPSPLPWRERAVVAWMAPRGIVAAAVASLFAIELEARGDPSGALFVPVTFTVIVACAAIYGLTTRPLARALGVSRPDPQGVLILGANAITRGLARILQAEGLRALIVDTDLQALTAARTEGLDAQHGNLLDTHAVDRLDLQGIGQLWAITPNDQLNSLAAVHLTDRFSRARVYQVAAGAEPNGSDPASVHGGQSHLRGRTLFGPDLDYRSLRERFTNPEWDIRRTPITDQFTWSDYRERNQDAIPLFLLTEDRRIELFAADHRPEVVAGKTVVGLVPRKPITAYGEDD